MPSDISIVITAIDAPPALLQDTLASICMQTGPTYEVILTTSGESSESLLTARAFQERMEIFAAWNAGLGRAAATNKGFELATGTLVVWLEPGDRLEPGALQAMAAAAVDKPQASFFLGSGFWVGDAMANLQAVYPEGFLFCRDALAKGVNYVFRPATFIRRESLRAMGGSLDETLSHAIDHDLWLRLSAISEPALVPLPVARARREETLLSVETRWAKLEETQKVCTRHTGQSLTPGLLAKLTELLLHVSSDPQVTESFAPALQAQVRSLNDTASHALRWLSGNPDGIPVKNSLVLYFSTKALVAGPSGGIVGYLVGLVNDLAARDDVAVHVGMTNYNYREINKLLSKNVVRHRLSGVGGSYITEREKALIIELKATWVIYIYPGADDLHADETRTFRTACCVPDLQHLTHPDFFSGAERTYRDRSIRLAIDSADLIFTLSTHAKKELATIYGCAEDRVKVIYPAAAPDFLHGPASEEEISRTKKRFKLPQRYAVFPGNFWPHKNHARLLDALSLLRRQGTKIPLVLTGNQDRAEPTLKARLAAEAAEGHLFILGYVKERHLHPLISGAACLVFPSLFEGFGIPVAEALALGVPVACSDICSLPEVGGQVARYFDPRRPEAIAQALEEVWTKGFTEEERVLAIQHAGQFNYAATVNQLQKALCEERRTPFRKHQCLVVHESPRVSIVTPSYQQAPYLRMCIESVLSQDYPYIDYAVFDGGSNDGSKEILQSFGSRFYWVSQPDGGQTHAINAGLKRASGDILAYLNSDDLLLPGAVSTVVDEWTQHPGVDLLYGRSNRINERGEILAEYPTREFYLEDFKSECFISQPATFWRREVVDRIGLFDECFQYAMDYEYWQRLARHDGVLMRINRLLACSREHSTTKTSSQRSQVFRDIFQSQQLHWGKVHERWWLGYLFYLSEERRGLWGLLLPRGRSYVRLARRCAFLTRRWPQWLRNPRLRDELLAEILGGHPHGFDDDGWIHTDMSLPLRVRERSRLYLEGYSPDTKKIHFSFGLGRGGAVQAMAGKKFNYEHELAPGIYQLRIQCPASRQTGDPRMLGFYMGATNLFLFR